MVSATAAVAAGDDEGVDDADVDCTRNEELFVGVLAPMRMRTR